MARFFRASFLFSRIFPPSLSLLLPLLPFPAGGQTQSAKILTDIHVDPHFPREYRRDSRIHGDISCTFADATSRVYTRASPVSRREETAGVESRRNARLNYQPGCYLYRDAAGFRRREHHGTRATPLRARSPAARDQTHPRQPAGRPR